MSLFNRLRDAVFGPHLRNRAGGLAYVNSNADEGHGEAQVVNHYVITRRFVLGGFWEIDPPLFYVATKDHFRVGGAKAYRGSKQSIAAFADCCLTPIPDANLSSDEIATLYADSPQGDEVVREIGRRLRERKERV